MGHDWPSGTVFGNEPILRHPRPMNPPRYVRRSIGAAVLVAILVVGAISGCTAPGAPAPSLARSAPGGVIVTDAWVRVAPAGGQSAAYLTIRNGGPADALVSVTSRIATSSMLHQTATDASGMTGMSMLDEVPVPAGATVQLAPGGTHVMLGGLGKALEAGGAIELELTFREAGVVVVPAAIRPG